VSKDNAGSNPAASTDVTVVELVEVARERANCPGEAEGRAE